MLLWNHHISNVGFSSMRKGKWARPSLKLGKWWQRYSPVHRGCPEREVRCRRGSHDRRGQHLARQSQGQHCVRCQFSGGERWRGERWR